MGVLGEPREPDGNPGLRYPRACTQLASPGCATIRFPPGCSYKITRAVPGGFHSTVI